MKNMTVKRITFVAMMAALASLGSLLTLFIPNFSLVLAFFLLMMTFAGFTTSSSVMLITVLLSNLRSGGIGPWTIFQICSYLIILIIWLLFLKTKIQLQHPLVTALFAALLGLSFGFWNALMSVPFYHLPSFVVYYLQGVYFDLSYCIATGVFYFIFARYLLPLLKRKVPELMKRS